MHTSPLSRWTTIATVCLLAAIAAIVSYAHMFELALRTASPPGAPACSRPRSTA